VCHVVGLSSLSKVKKILFFFLPRKGERDCVFAVFFASVPEKEILDFIAHGSLIRVFTVYCEVTSETCKQDHEGVPMLGNSG